MLVNEHQYGLLLFRSDGSALGSMAINVDFEPAVEWAQLYHARRGHAPLFGGPAAALVRPLWDTSNGQPYIRGFRVESGKNQHDALACDFAAKYFSEAAIMASAQLVERGQLAEGETFLYRVAAWPAAAKESSTEAALGLTVVEEQPAVTLGEASLAEFVRRSSPVGLVDPGDMPVFISRHVLDEATALTRQADGRETGGILIGHLYRDPSLPEIFVEVTAQVASEHTQGSLTKLTFTPDTWTAADVAIRQRSRTEIFTGYAHSHCCRHWLGECTPEEEARSALARDFFSEEDRLLLRTCFARAYSIGLVANDTAHAGITFSLFGWQQNGIAPRGFYALEDSHE